MNFPPDPCKYFGCELGAQTQMDQKIARYIVNGAHESSKLQDMLDGFIKKFVMCGECENPETELVSGKDYVNTACSAVVGTFWNCVIITLRLCLACSSEQGSHHAGLPGLWVPQHGGPQAQTHHLHHEEPTQWRGHLWEEVSESRNLQLAYLTVYSRTV